MNLSDLYEAIREFVPVGGLRDWDVRIRATVAPGLSAFYVSGRVPDRETGTRRKIEMYEAVSVSELVAMPISPREFVRALIRKFVLHEADEGIGFRRMPMLPRAWVPSATLTAAASVDLTVERPFDPHASTQPAGRPSPDRNEEPNQ